MIQFTSSKRSLVWLFMTGLMLFLIGFPVVAQNLGTAPQVNVAVQGQTGAQPEGSWFGPPVCLPVRNLASCESPKGSVVRIEKGNNGDIQHRQVPDSRAKAA